ncbi:MAG: CBS domain-containing protein [Alphaproteobacteria bacterium]
MSIVVAHIMSSDVVFASLDHTVDHVRELMASKHINALPVVDKNKKIIGIVTTADVARRVKDDTLVSHVMSDMVVMVGATESVGVAARSMREHRIHHLVVTDDRKVVGIVSSYDLLELFEKTPV